jgi:hypothetical protein
MANSFCMPSKALRINQYSTLIFYSSFCCFSGSCRAAEIVCKLSARPGLTESRDAWGSKVITAHDFKPPGKTRKVLPF